MLFIASFFMVRWKDSGEVAWRRRHEVTDGLTAQQVYERKKERKEKERNITLTNELTPWSKVLLEKLKCPKLLKKFPAFFGTRRFITVYTRARHLSLS
jgi:hypothetical protein